MAEAAKPASSAQGHTGTGQDKFSAAFANYGKVLQGLQDDIQRRQAEAYFKYLRACMEAWNQSDAAKRIEAAYASYLSESSESFSPARMGEAQKRTVEAWQSCLGNVQEALASVNLSTLDPRALAQVGQNLITAAYYSAWIPRA
jgi:hypothetical protein